MKLKGKHLGEQLFTLGVALSMAAIVGIGAVEALAPNPAAASTVQPGPWRFPEMDEVLARAAARPGEDPGAVHANGPAKKRTAPEIFTAAGCIACHNPTAGPFYKNLVAARQVKTPTQIAAWIRNPQRFKPTTQMPNLSAVVSEDDAQELAKWIKAGNPVGPIPADLPTPVAMPADVK